MNDVTLVLPVAGRSSRYPGISLPRSASMAMHIAVNCFETEARRNDESASIDFLVFKSARP